MRTVSLLTLCLLSAPLLEAQQPNSPHLGYVYPAGGRQGTSVQVKLGGQFLDGATNAFVTGAGIRTKVLEQFKPLTPQQANALRDKLKELQDKRIASQQRRQGGPTNATFTAADAQALMEIRQKLATFQRRPANPAIAETVTLQVTLAADAEPGQHELRLRTLAGLSNPLRFYVGQLPEFRKPAPVSQEPRPGLRNSTEQRAVAPTEMTVSLPAVLNGQILQGGVDRYRFPARKGQQLVLAVSARDLIPYLPDAVPGWFQAALTLSDAKGHELAYADHFRFQPDPVILYEIPADGDYLLEVRDSIYRGRDDFVYRIAAGELPFMTSIFPLGGPAGEQTAVELQGWNLPTNQVVQDGRQRGPGVYPLSVRREQWCSNPLPFALDTLPECLEQEPNDSRGTAQALKLPIIVNGRISQPGDRDAFRFEGHAGEQVVAEVYARRLDSPLDSVLELTDARGNRLAFNDDHEDKGTGLNTHHADSYLTATLPADGTYYLELGDTQHQGGPEFSYRLRLSSPQPDFALRVAPASISARAGMNVPLTVYALRRDGFTNEIALALDDAPAGFSLSGARLPAGQDQVRVTLAVPDTPSPDPLTISLEGRALLGGKPVTRPVVPAEDMMQAFAYRHLVPAQQLMVAVSGNGRFPARTLVRVLGTTPVKIPAGGTARVRLATPTRAFAERWDLELSEPPDGLAIQRVGPSDEGAELVLRSDAAKTKPGLKGNLIVNLLPGKELMNQKQGKAGANNRRVVATLPAIPFEIVEQ